MDTFFTQTATSNSAQDTSSAFFTPPRKDKKMVYNTKLQKNTAPTTVLTAFFHPDGSGLVSMCVDTGSETSCISKAYQVTHFPEAEIKPSATRLRGVGPDAVHVLGTVVLDIPMRTLDEKHFIIPVEALVVDSLDCGLLLGTDTCVPNGFIIDFTNDSISTNTGFCFYAKSEWKETKALPKSLKKWGIYTAESQVIDLMHGVALEIYHSQMDGQGDMLLQMCPVAQVDATHDTFGSIPAALLTSASTTLPYANLGDSQIRIRKGQLLGYVEAPAVLSCTEMTVNLVAQHQDQNLDDVQILTVLPPVGEVEPLLATEADVSGEWGPDYQAKVFSILDKHQHLFRAELGLFNDCIEMPICFHDDRDVKGLKQPCFPLSLRDRKAMDSILDPLAQQDRLEKVPLTHPSPVSSPAFVVWNKEKPRVVIDLRKVNGRLIPNAYPLP